MCKQRLYHSIPLVVLLVWVATSPLTLASSPNAERNVSAHSATTAPASTATAANGIRINEVMFSPGAGNEWVEIKNTGTTSIGIGGYGVTDEDQNWYRIPNDLPRVPRGAFVVVVFDGAGSAGNDYDFSDNVATLHTPPGLVSVFENEADQCALYTSAPGYSWFLPLLLKNFVKWNPPVPQPPSDFPAPAIVSFVAWGANPGADAASAFRAGIWIQGAFKNLTRGLGEDSGGPSLPDETLGLLPGSQTNTVDDWTLYVASQKTRGRDNAVPVISWYYPPAGGTIDSATFAVSWNPVEGATSYRFQMDNNSDFSSPIVDLTLASAAYVPSTQVAQGVYHWRVKVLFRGGESSWSSGVEIRSLTLPYGAVTGMSTSASKTLNIVWQLQHKDTNMLCLDGDPETGDSAWDHSHTARGNHGNNYCVRASVSMLASYYGGKLSQDRISYEIFKGGAAEGDLGHNVATSRQQAIDSLSWALGANAPTQMGKPTFDQIKAWIGANRPMRAVIPGHSRAIDGYWEFSIGPLRWQFLHILDPWDRAKWVNYGDDNIQYVQVAPAGPGGAPNVKSDEDADGDGIADTRDDSDGDGICDFDERNRFNLNPADTDADDDLIPDKLDLRDYLFTEAGAYSRRNPDIDGDGLRKERDPDNDYAQNNGLVDGCEDSNQNGKCESNLGETDNFMPSDDMNLHVQLTWPGLGTDVDVHLIRPGSQMWSDGDCYWSNRSPEWGMPGVSCDNPRLDIDCISDCTVENIRLSKLENGVYSVSVHYYSDHDLGPTSPIVTVTLQGVRYDFGPQELASDDVWNVCTIQWPSKVVTPGGLVSSLSGTERMTRPEK